jgi:hypothetical protein
MLNAEYSECVAFIIMLGVSSRTQYADYFGIGAGSLQLEFASRIPLLVGQGILFNTVGKNKNVGHME